jgi:hypothetical protein
MNKTNQGIRTSTEVIQKEAKVILFIKFSPFSFTSIQSDQ